MLSDFLLRQIICQAARPLSSEVTITNGIISSIRSMKNVGYGPDIQLLQINADINEGNGWASAE